LIPLFGNQRILIGDTVNVQEKLGHLFAFYKNVSSKIGWDKYETLDVRFKNQVVASPSIGWIPPKATDTTTAIIEGPDPKASVSTVAAVKPAVAKPAAQTVKPAVQTVKPVIHAVAKQKPTLKPAVVKQNIVKAKPATVKPKSVVQASSKAKEKKKEAVTNKDKTKTQSPKYIYPGKHSGNH
jgi:cell division protein FtsQ